MQEFINDVEDSFGRLDGAAVLDILIIWAIIFALLMALRGTTAMTLLRGGIAGLPTALRLARATLRTIHQNLFWAFVYNLIGLPLAAGVLQPLLGWSLSPVFASAAA